MAPLHGASAGALLCLLLCLLFVLNVTPTETFASVGYDRETLLRIRAEVGGISRVIPELRCNDFLDCPTRETRTRKHRGRRSGVRVRQRECPFKPPLPSIYLANMQSLRKKVDELLARIQFQREARDCSVFCLTETWLKCNVLDSAFQPPGFSVFRTDRSKDATGKKKGGGVCFLVNEKWCADTVVVNKTCTADLECLVVKCRPFHLPREFPAVFLIAVYIHPRADARRLSMNWLRSFINLRAHTQMWFLFRSAILITATSSQFVPTFISM